MKKLITFIVFLSLLGINDLVAQSDVTIYWDASYSMKDRNIDREFNYLNNYFKKYKNAKTHLVVFSNDIILEENFDIKEGNWNNLRNELQSTVYDGATYYSTLFKHDSNSFIIFTDGIENLDKLEPPINKPITIVSTISNQNAAKLKRIADASKGSYVVLDKDFDIPKKNSQSVSFDTAEDGLITGIVTSGGEALPLANIVNKRTSKSATSTVDGQYSIEAERGDILVFTFLGKKTVNVKVLTNQMNIRMIDINQVLDEVVVKAEVDTEELVNTGNTTIDKKRLGYDVKTINKDDISAIDTDVIGAVKGQFANLQIANDVYNKVDLSQFTGRGRNMSILLNQYGLIVVDGVPQEQSNSGAGSQFGSRTAGSIDPEMIESITYLKGLAATNKYGTLGRNGVLLITTKNALSGKDKRKKDIVLGTTATYSDSAELMEKLPETNYMKALQKAKSVDEAFKIYLMQREKHGTKAEYFIDSYDYFKGWNNNYMSNRILSNIYESFFDTAEILRALAFKQTNSKAFEEALFTYKRILKLKPNQAQSYTDVARAEIMNGHFQEALKIYDRIDKMRNIGKSNFTGIEKTVNNDFKNLISLHKKDLNTAGVNPKFLKTVKHKARIIFEWNNPDTEFDLQIVNPQKRFFTWEHTKSKSAQRIAEEKQQGYGLEEFYLTSSDVGEWLFNIKYLGSGKSTDIPSFLRVTIYKDFGYPNQTMETLVIRLTKKGKLQTAVKLKIN